MASLSPSSPSSPPLLPVSPKPKSVAFAPPASLAVSSSAHTSPVLSPADLPPTPSTSSSPDVDAPPTPTRPGPPKRRRSSLKQGLAMPFRPPKELYQHPDPLLRRLRLRNGYGKEVNLQKEFAEAKVVLFFFGATWPGSLSDPYDAVRAFASEHPHQCKVVYVSVDSSEQAYDNNTRQKPWLSMEWNDGSNLDTPLASSSSPLPSLPSPLEPFLLAGDTDLEEDLSHSDPSLTGELYLRPYSRVYLAEKWNVLGIPNLAVYHPGTRKMLSYHARFEALRKGGNSERSWEKWSKGEKVEFTTGDFLYAIRYSLGAAALASAYMVAVRGGYLTDVLGQATQKLSEMYIANR